MIDGWEVEVDEISVERSDTKRHAISSICCVLNPIKLTYSMYAVLVIIVGGRDL